MNYREILINEISAPYLLFKNLKLYYPNTEDKYIASEIYKEWYKIGTGFGLYNEDELLDFLLIYNLWNADKEEKLEGLRLDIDKLKIGLFECMFRSNEKLTIKKNLKNAKEVYKKMYYEKHCYDFLGSEYFADSCQNIYLCFCCIKNIDGSDFVNKENIFDISIPMLEEIMYFRSSKLYDDVTIRDLARHEPWRSLWNVNKSDIFGNTLNLNYNQLLLLTWSNVYDNVYENMDCPSDVIIDDDDALDGWFLVQKNKRDKERRNKESDDMIKNPKIKNSQEVFIPADTLEDAEKIYALNNVSERMKIKQRMEFIRQRGVVKEIDLPDVRQRLMMEAQQKFRNQIMEK